MERRLLTWRQKQQQKSQIPVGRDEIISNSGNFLQEVELQQTGAFRWFIQEVTRRKRMRTVSPSESKITTWMNQQLKR